LQNDLGETSKKWGYFLKRAQLRLALQACGNHKPEALAKETFYLPALAL
jgi:hypothetical protein